MWQDDDDRPPSPHEILRFEAYAIGEGHPDLEWVLTDYDIWERNPHYTGVRTEGHPEDREEDCTGAMCGPVWTPPVHQDRDGWWGPEDDDIPF